MSLHLNNLFLICINIHHPYNYAKLTVTHGFNSIFVHHAVKKQHNNESKSKDMPCADTYAVVRPYISIPAHCTLPSASWANPLVCRT